MDFVPIPPVRCLKYLKKLRMMLAEEPRHPGGEKVARFVEACIQAVHDNKLDQLPYCFWNTVLTAIRRTEGSRQDEKAVRDWIEYMLGIECRLSRR